MKKLAIEIISTEKKPTFVYTNEDVTIKLYKEVQIRTVKYELEKHEKLETPMVDEIIGGDKYDHELLNLKGKVWLLFSHVYPFRNDNEEKYMMELLLSKGSELLDVKKYEGSSAYYVDTKNPKPEKK